MISKITLKNISKNFKTQDTEVIVLKNIDFEFKQGVSYAIRGVSGSGKSTLLFIIAGLEPASAGEVFFDNFDLSAGNEKEKSKILQEKIGIVFQSPYLIDELSVLENVALKGIIEKKSLSEFTKQANLILQELGISDKKNLSTKLLSGGQQQRVAVARAIFNNPHFILADEPTAHLDKENGKNIINILKRYQTNNNSGLILSSHDPEVADMMDVILELQNGKLHEIQTF